MAAVTRLLSSPHSSSASIFFHTDSIPSSCTYNRSFISKTRVSSLKSQANNQSSISTMERSSPDFEKTEEIQEIHCIEEYDRGHQVPQEKLVIAHFSATHHTQNSKIQQFMGEHRSNGVKFLHVMANESEKTKQLCRREKIDRIPHFVFYKGSEKVHEEAGFQPEKLARDVLYYRDDPSSPVVRLRSREDLEKLMGIRKPIVLIVGKNRCVPCVKMYPSALELASQMAGEVVFARMNADENIDGWRDTLREMEVRRVPAVLFLRNGGMCGRYVGSCTSSLVREVVKFRRDDITTSVFFREKIASVLNSVVTW